MSLSKARKVLFVHDGPVFEHGENYYGLHYNNKLVERYKFLGDEVTFLIRVSHMEQAPTGRYSHINDAAFRVIEFPNLKSLKARLLASGKAEEVTRNAVLASDVVIARLPSSSGSLAVKYAQKYKKPLMVEFVACGWDAYWNYNWKGKLVAPYFFLKQRLRMSKVPYVIYVTNEFLQRRYPAKGISAGISDVELPLQDSTVLQKRLQKIQLLDDSAALNMVTVAAVDVPYKGQADVIEAVYKLKQQGFKINYHIVGQGNQDRFRGLINKYGLQEQVKLVGSLTHDQVFPFLDSMDVYIQPSRQEGLPRAVIEALSRGLAVLGSNVGGIPELINKDYVFAKGDIGDIALKIRMLNKKVLTDYAHFGVGVAKQYSKELLDEKRKSFYTRFLKENNLLR